MVGMCHKTIDKLLSYLTTDNLRIIHISQKINSNIYNNNEKDKTVAFDQTSYWYKVPYHLENIAVYKLEQWKNPRLLQSLSLPPANPYIVSNPIIYSKEGTTRQIPEVVEQSDGLTIWYKQDITFKVPKGYIYINIDAPQSIASIKNIAMTRLLVDLYSDTLIEENYDAELAGIHYHLYAHQGGVTLELSGISEKQGDLLAKLLKSLKGHQLNKKHFELLKQQLLNYWNNSDTSKSISQLFSSLSSMMQPLNTSSDELKRALTNIDFDHFVNFSQTVFREINIEVLIHGNWLTHHVNQISKVIKNTFSSLCSAKHTILLPILDISANGELIIPINLPDHDYACIVYYPQPDKNIKTIAKVMISTHFLSPLFFQEMRTEKQYGYLVGVGYIPLNRYPGIAFYIQSPHTPPADLASAIDDFISTSITVIEQMTDEEWQHLQQGLSGQLQENDSSLRVKSQRFWAALCNDDIEFNHKKQLINSILSITLHEIKIFITENLAVKSKPDRLLLVSSTDKVIHPITKDQTIINNISDFSKKCQRKY